jgi:hypothetical protein
MTEKIIKASVPYKGKTNKVEQVLREYRKTAQAIAKLQWVELGLKHSLSKDISKPVSGRWLKC